jgi:putative thioredoxin
VSGFQSLPQSLGGALDLSSLVNRQPAGAGAGAGASQVSQDSAPSAAAASIEVASLVMDVTPATLASFVKLSERVPILVEFHTLRSESAPQLSAKLAAEVQRRNGDVLLLRIDGDNPQAAQLLQAFQVQGLPAVCALLMGQPLALFSGNQEESVLKQVLDRYLLLARENGINGAAVVSETAEAPKQPELPPHHKAAYEAIEAGEYATAVAEFEAALREAPADAVALRGLAQAQLLVRTDNKDLEQILTTPAAGLEDVLLKADVLAVIGHFDKSFDALLDTFAAADKDDREKLRAHLLELFKVAGGDNPAVAAARSRLASLLF